MREFSPETRLTIRLLFWFSVVFLITFTLTLPDYGITWDSAASEFYMGDKYFYFFTSLDWSYLDFAADNIAIYHDPKHPDYHAYIEYVLRRPHHMWSVGPTLSALSKHLLFTKLGTLDPIDAQHFILGPLVLLLCVSLFFSLRQGWGLWVGFSAGLFFLSQPRIWAEIHNNVKDVPALVLLSLVLLSAERAVRTGKRAHYMLSFGLFGVALAAKANALLIPIILLPAVLWSMYENSRTGGRLFSPRIAALFFGGVLTTLFVFFCAWPLMLLEFPKHVIEYWRYLTRAQELGPASWQLLPLKQVLYTTPPLIFLAALVGMAFAVKKCVALREERPLVILLFTWTLVPILRVSLPGAYHIDGIRHFMEYTMPLSIFAALGLVSFACWLQKLCLRATAPQPKGIIVAAALSICLLPSLVWNIRNHPFGVCYHNILVGGLAGAQAKHLPESTDYWGSSYRVALRWVNQNLEPQAVLVTGVGEHIIALVSKIWLRPNISLLPIASLENGLSKLHTLPEAQRPAIYLMYITREEVYSDLVRRLDKELPSVWELQVEGAPIVKVKKIN